MSLLRRFVQEAARRAVVVTEDVGVLQELFAVYHLLKFIARDEVVLLAILLAPAEGTSRVGNRKVEVRNQFHQFGDERGFPGARRRGDDVHQRLVGRGIHSRFCTCSRDFSISAFMANPASVIFKASPASPDVFESRVLDSRFISCRRKSSFLPTSPPSSSKPRKCCTWFSSRTSSSWISLRSTRSAASCRTRSLSTIVPISS